VVVIILLQQITSPSQNMVSPARHRGFAETYVRTGTRVLRAGALPNIRIISGLALALILGMLLVMQPGQHQAREYPRSRAEMRTGGSVHPTGHASSSSTCQALRGTGFHLLDDATNVPDACGHLPVPALRIANDEYSICARTAHNLMDSHLRASKGYWPDCAEIFHVLDKEAAPVPVGITARTPAPTKGLVVDVGANVGSCTMWLAARGYDVVSFEPKPIHVAMIKASASLNADIGRRITLHGIGLSDKSASGVVLVSESSNSGNSWIFMGSPQEATNSSEAIGGPRASTVSADTGIALGRLDDFCVEPIEILKVDTQGFELHVLRGATRLLHQGAIRRIKLEFWPFGLRKHGSDPVQLLELLHEHGYALSEGGNALRRTEFQALVDRLCPRDDLPGCANHFVDVVAIRHL